MISERQHITNSFGRFKANAKDSKFSINADEQKGDDEAGDTFMDSVWKQLKRQKVSSVLLDKLCAFIEDEEFDTDAIDADVGTVNKQCNIGQHLNDQKCVEQIRRILQCAHGMSSHSLFIGHIIISCCLCTNRIFVHVVCIDTSSIDRFVFGGTTFLLLAVV